MLYIGQKVRHKDVYNGKETLKLIGLKEKEVLLEGDFSGGTHNVNQEAWLPKKGLIYKNIWGFWLDSENDIDFTKNAGPRD